MKNDDSKRLASLGIHYLKTPFSFNIKSAKDSKILENKTILFI